MKLLIFLLLIVGSEIHGSKIVDKSLSTGFKGHGKGHGKAERVWPTLTGEPPLLMAHRGEKVLLPEHTVGSYEFAAIEGADFVEPDLVLTQDGILVCFHDLTLRTGTDVSSRPEFAHKMVNFTGEIDEDGGNVTILNNWFIKDFTLEELKNLTVTQKEIGIRPQVFNGHFKIPTFLEYLDTVHHKAYQLDKPIGIIPELKHPKFHNIFLNSSENYMEELVLRTLRNYGYPLLPNDTERCVSVQDSYARIPCGHLILQSFELSCLAYLHNRTNVDKMMLIDVQFPLLTYQGLKDISLYAQYYSVWKELLYTGILAQIEFEGLEYDKEMIDQMGGFVPPRSLADEAHALGMKVGIYTIYDSREPSHRGCTSGSCDPENKEEELYYYFEMGVDGIFVENVIEAREIRMKYQYQVISSDYHPKGISAGDKLTPFRLISVFLVILMRFY